MSTRAIRLVSSKTRRGLYSIHLQCHVKPGVSKQRNGITSISDSIIHVCVSARAKEGEAN
ncbi:hypothetical protein BJ878DRAFT_330859 [Calycina marina]|uniref:Uncharacterized protein n=1 Tax=Calycina marina TaxID=1763456 RepID=A0A9P8CGI1_9HELO|nr:hypothetical protein BJ878DRAFT_330859 [Calycina marina]